MTNVEEVLRESIQDKCGLGGLMRFNAIYTGGFETADGRPDLAGISAAINGAFPADQAAAVLAALEKKLGKGSFPAKGGTMPAPESPRSGDLEGPQAFAKFFDVDPNHVRDIVNEARRLRAAMGKSMPSQWAPHADKVVVDPAPAPAANAPGDAALVQMITEIRMPVEERVPLPEAGRSPPGRAPGQPAPLARLRPPRVIAEPLSAVDEEIRRFAYGQTAYSSIDIMDFIRYLKDKGYSLQEYIVLEKIYVTIEERKKEARFAIEKEIEGLIDATQAPAEPDILELLKRLNDAGLVFDEDDVRRAVRDALMRRSSNG